MCAWSPQLSLGYITCEPIHSFSHTVSDRISCQAQKENSEGSVSWLIDTYADNWGQMLLRWGKTCFTSS